HDDTPAIVKPLPIPVAKAQPTSDINDSADNIQLADNTALPPPVVPIQQPPQPQHKQKSLHVQKHHVKTTLVAKPHWVVQMGCFKDSKNAKILEKKLQNKGF